MLSRIFNNLQLTKGFWTVFLVCDLAFAQIQTDTRAIGRANLPASEINIFISNERQALEALSSGTKRLERLCAAPLKPQPDRPTAQDLNDLRSQIQDRSQRIGASAERSVSLTQFAVTSARQDNQQACSPLNRMKSLFMPSPADLPSCDITKRQLELATNLNITAKEWFQIHEERKRLFGQLILLESNGCTRNGFAQRMVQAHERSLAVFEDQALTLFENALRREVPTSGNKP